MLWNNSHLAWQLGSCGLGTARHFELLCEEHFSLQSSSTTWTFVIDFVHMIVMRIATWLCLEFRHRLPKIFQGNQLGEKMTRLSLLVFVALIASFVSQGEGRRRPSLSGGYRWIWTKTGGRSKNWINWKQHFASRLVAAWSPFCRHMKGCNQQPKPDSNGKLNN